MKSLLFLFIKSANPAGLLIILGIMLCVLNSCSVQQRRYRPGFYITHASAKPDLKKQDAGAIAKPAELIKKKSEAPAPGLAGPPLEIPGSIIASAHIQPMQLLTIAKQVLIKSGLTPVAPAKTYSLSTEELEPTRKPFSRSAILGFVFGIGAVFACLFGLFVLFDSTSALIVPAMLVFLILVIAAFVRSAMAIVQIAENPGEYRGLWMALVGISLAAICFLFLAWTMMYGDVFR